MKKTGFFLVILVSAVFFASCGDKNPTKDDDYVPNTMTSTPEDTGTITVTNTITPTYTVTLSRTASPTSTDTATETITPTLTFTSTATVTPTSTPLTLLIYTGVNVTENDTYISSGAVNNNYGSCPNLLVGANIAGTNVQRTLVKHGVANAMVGVPGTVYSVSLKVRLNAAPTGSGTINAYRIADSWVEGKFCDASSTTTCTWARRDGTNFWAVSGGNYYTTVEGSVSYNSSMSAGTTLTMPLTTALLTEFIQNSSTNYGLLLMLSDETPAGDTSAQFYGAGAGASWNPCFEVIYRP